MNVRQLTARVPLRPGLRGAPDADRVIDVFHRLIRDRNSSQDGRDSGESESDEPNEGLFHGQLLIDVADYRHVADGPGVLLVAHQAVYSLGANGLEVSIKRDELGPANDKIEDVVTRLFALAAVLESDSTIEVEFELSRIEVGVGDRLLDIDADRFVTTVAASLEAHFGRPVSSEARGADPGGFVAAISRIS